MGSRSDDQRARPPRVLAVLPGVDSDGGAEVSYVAIVETLRRSGFVLHLAVLTSRQGLVGKLERLGVVVHDLSGTTGLTGRALALRRVIAAVDPDLVHASLFEATAPSQLAVLGLRTPLLVTWANVNYGPPRRAERGAPRWKVLAYQLVEAVLGRASSSWYHAVTPEVGRLNAHALRVPPSRVLVGTRGRDPEQFPCAHRRSAGDDGGPVLLAVGRQDHQKGYDDLLGAVDDVADRWPGLRLRIAGRSGTGTEALLAAHACMRHPEVVELLGQRDDVPDLMADADAVVCASWREGAAGALLEAMASCVPIATVELPGLEGVLVDGETAIVVPRQRLADGIARVLDDPASARCRTRRAREVFEQRFTVASAARRMDEIYRTVSRR